MAETLEGTEWDVVIVGTGVPESLLALSLSRSGTRILHLDPNGYYGGDAAAFSLQEAETWAERHGHEAQAACSDSQHPELASSRAYSLALAPHLIYARSNLISTVVSARLHHQLDFQAVGAWFVLDPAAEGGSLVKVPGGREDVFADTALDLKSKRSLMKFLRFVADYEEKGEVWRDEKETPFPTFLTRKFGLPEASLAPILALTMSEGSPAETSTEHALSRIARHARSIGTFGPGFGAVLPKWGGLAEVAQVACRACAVGGGVYVLGKGIKSSHRRGDGHSTALELDGGDKITTKWLVSSNRTSLGLKAPPSSDTRAAKTSKSISIVSSSLVELFPPTSEGGVTPAGAVVAMPAASDEQPPVYIFAHTSEAGECPTGQCILYASVASPHEQGFSRLAQSVDALLQAVNVEPRPELLWRLQYEQTYLASSLVRNENGIITLPSLSSGLALEDEVLDGVKEAWRLISGGDLNAFMRFDAREGIGEDND